VGALCVVLNADQGYAKQLAAKIDPAKATPVVSHGTQMTFAVFGDGEALIVKSAEWRVAA